MLCFHFKTIAFLWYLCCLYIKIICLLFLHLGLQSLLLLYYNSFGVCQWWWEGCRVTAKPFVLLSFHILSTSKYKHAYSSCQLRLLRYSSTNYPFIMMTSIFFVNAISYFYLILPPVFTMWKFLSGVIFLILTAHTGVHKVRKLGVSRCTTQKNSLVYCLFE